MKRNIENEFESYFLRIVNRRAAPNYKSRTLEELKAISNLESLSIEQVITKSILDYESKNKNPYDVIRPDAKVLLIINFSDMVYYPLSKSRVVTRVLLKRQIYKEVKTLLIESHKEDEEISSHKLLEVGLKIWNTLKLLSKDSW